MASQKYPAHSLFDRLGALEQQPTNAQKLQALEVLIDGLRNGEISMSHSAHDLETVLMRLHNIHNRLSAINQNVLSLESCGQISHSLH